MVNGFACWWSGTGSLLFLFYMCFLSFLFLDFLFLFLALLFSKQQSFYNRIGKEEWGGWRGGKQIYTENGIFLLSQRWNQNSFLAVPDNLFCSRKRQASLLFLFRCHDAFSFSFLLLLSVSRRQKEKIWREKCPCMWLLSPFFPLPFSPSSCPPVKVHTSAGCAPVAGSQDTASSDFNSKPFGVGRNVFCCPEECGWTH